MKYERSFVTMKSSLYTHQILIFDDFSQYKYILTLVLVFSPCRLVKSSLTAHPQKLAVGTREQKNNGKAVERLIGEGDKH